MPNKWFLERSFKQKCFHIEEAQMSIKHNLSAFVAGGGSDYVPIGIFNTQDEAFEMVKMIRSEYPLLVKDDVTLESDGA